MLILHASDFHLGLTRHSQPGTTSRADDLAATLDLFVRTAIARKVDLALLAGDACHTRKPFPRDLFALTKAAATLSDAGVTFLVSQGNHEGNSEVGKPASATLGFLTHVQPDGVEFLIHPIAKKIVSLSGAPFNLVSVPYPHRSAFDAVLPDASPEDRIEEIGRVLESSIATYVNTIKTENPGLPTVFLGHLSVLGAKLGTEVAMRFGWDVAVRSGIFDTVDYAALGHIHRQQQIGDRAWYSGSPDFLDFGEEGQPKGFLLVEVEAGKPPKVEVISSEPRAMVTVQADWVNDKWRLRGDTPEGAIVRLIANMADGTKATDIAKLTQYVRLKRGASYVRTDVVQPDAVARSKRALDSRIDEKSALQAWLEAGGLEIEPTLSVGMQVIRALAQANEEVGGFEDA